MFDTNHENAITFTTADSINLASRQANNLYSIANTRGVKLELTISQTSSRLFEYYMKLHIDKNIKNTLQILYNICLPTWNFLETKKNLRIKLVQNMYPVKLPYSLEPVSRLTSEVNAGAPGANFATNKTHVRPVY